MYRFLTNILARLKRKPIPRPSVMTSPVSPSTGITQPLAVLDTNSVHYVRLYLRLAREHNLPPYGTVAGDIQTELTRIIGKSKALETYRKGASLFDELVNKTSTGWRIEYSPFTHLELACGGLRGAAIEDAIKEKMLARWWNRMDEYEILDRLDLTVYAKVRTETDDIEALFDSVGIVMSPCDRNRLAEVLEMAKAILGLVYLEAGDCLIYASSLVGLADELWTSDGYFRAVVSGIENPGGASPVRQAYFRQVRRGIVDVLSKLLSIDSSKVQLPKGRA